MGNENYKFFQNEKCEYFPCHSIHDKNNFSCLLCYCPLSPYKECGGNYIVLNNGWKDCSNCLTPHYNYDYVIEKLIKLYNENKKGDINIVKIKIKYHTDIEKMIASPKGDWIDLRAAETVKLNKGEFKFISLGISMELPEGYEANIVPRSSTYKNFKIIQANSFGVVDNSYCGDNDIWKFPALAMEDTIINKGDRICQFRINKNMRNENPILLFVETEALDNKDRGGFGTTGI